MCRKYTEWNKFSKLILNYPSFKQSMIIYVSE